MAAKVKKGDKVVVITGRDKGRSGEVIEVRPAEGRVLVRGVNMVVRHQRQTAGQQGGIIRNGTLRQKSAHLRRIPRAMQMREQGRKQGCIRFQQAAHVWTA